MSMLRVKCSTYFDITATGVRSHYKSSRIPFRDDAGHDITNMEQWHRARNQQRNWETINQVISLRVSPENITQPEVSQKDSQRIWQFEFDVNPAEAIMVNDDPVGLLVRDCEDVPMLSGLDETYPVGDRLSNDANIFFSGSGYK